jgi:hypothetical protein
MALRSTIRSSKKPTPAEQAQVFKAAQERMKQDAARRRAAAEKAPTAGRRRRP